MVRLVPADRTSTVAGELGYSTSTPIDDDEARHLGTLADADIVIVGRTDGTGRDLILSARLVGVRSLASQEVTARGSRVGQIKPLVLSFSERVAGSLAAAKEELSSQKPEERILAEARGLIGGRELPAVYLSVTEEYGGDRRAASDTEDLLVSILTATGFGISPDITGADIILFARASGRAEERVRSAVISAADLELRAVTRIGGTLLFQESFSHSAVDAFASTAGTRAFREGILLSAGSLLLSLAEGSRPPPDEP
jgi:hypothetical protein